MEFAENLRQAREKKGYTQQDVSKLMGIDKSTYCGYETGKRQPDVLKLKKIANILGTSVDELLGIDGNMPTDASPYHPTHRIPILGRISAGLPLYAEEHIEGYTYTELNGGAEYFALRVTGDSMTAARIYDGDTLIIRRQDYVENGQIAVVIVGDDEATVKRFYQTSTTVTLMPQSTNPIHQPQIYDLKKTNIRVVGLVVKNEITF